MSEKVGGAEGTKLDDDFREMEKVNIHNLLSFHINETVWTNVARHVPAVAPLQKVDVTSRAVLDIMTKTTEYLQPNPGMYC